MPIYEYECRGCGHSFDVLQKISDSVLRKCPECGALKLQRLVSAPQFRLKGTGWYETDFKKDGRKRVIDAGDGAGAGKDAGADAGKADKSDAPAKAEKTGKADTADKSAKSAAAGAGAKKPAPSARAGKPAGAAD